LRREAGFGCVDCGVLSQGGALRTCGRSLRMAQGVGGVGQLASFISGGN